MNISSEELGIVRAILAKFFSRHETEVYLFGSRVSGRSRHDSDLDMMIKGSSEIPLNRMSLLREAFEESPLTYKVDIVDFYRISENFRNKIFVSGKKIDFSSEA